MKSTRIFGAFVATASLASLFVLCAQACGGGDEGSSTTDAAPSDTKADTKETGGPPTQELTVLDKDKVDVPADLSCVGGKGDAGVDSGSGDAGGDAGPAPGTPVEVTFKVLQFAGSSSDFVAGVDVDLFYKNTLLAGPPEAKGKTDDKGLVKLTVPFGTLFTYRVNPNDLLRTFVYYDSDPVTKTDGTYELTAITKSKYDQFALAITGKTGFLTAPGTGIYSARVNDCKGANVRNAVVELVDAETGTPLPTGPGDADLKEVHYLSDQDLPNIGATFTSRSGLIAAINVPETKAGAKKLKAIAKGLFGGSKELRKFAEADLEITAAAVNFRAIVPR